MSNNTPANNNLQSAIEATKETMSSEKTRYGIPYSVADVNIPLQLHQCWNSELNNGTGAFVVDIENLDASGSRNWAMVTLSFPEANEEGEIRVRLGINAIKGNRVSVMNPETKEVMNTYEALIPDASRRGSKSEMARFRTNYILLRDLFLAGAFDKQTQGRIASWARAFCEGRSSSTSLTLVPQTEEAVFAFNIKLNFDVNSGTLAKNTPIGIDRFYIKDFGLLGGLAMSGFGKYTVSVNADIVDTTVKVQTAAELVAAQDISI